MNPWALRNRRLRWLCLELGFQRPARFQVSLFTNDIPYIIQMLELVLICS